MKRAGMILAALLLAPAAAHADDIQQWNAIGVSYAATHEVSLAFEQEVRFDEDVSRLESVMPEASLEYRVRKWLRFGAGYRLQYSRDNDGELGIRHRFHAYGRVRRDLGDTRLEYRLQAQEQLRPGANDPRRHVVRHRVSVDYRAFKPWIPEASVEAFLAIADGDPVAFDKLWLTVGGAHVTKERAIEVFYRLEQPVNDPMDPTLHILGLGIGFDL